jgi:hypothetical protein
VPQVHRPQGEVNCYAAFDLFAGRNPYAGGNPVGGYYPGAAPDIYPGGSPFAAATNAAGSALPDAHGCDAEATSEVAVGVPPGDDYPADPDASASATNAEAPAGEPGPAPAQAPAPGAGPLPDSGPRPQRPAMTGAGPASVTFTPGHADARPESWLQAVAPIQAVCSLVAVGLLATLLYRKFLR